MPYPCMKIESKFGVTELHVAPVKGGTFAVFVDQTYADGHPPESLRRDCCTLAEAKQWLEFVAEKWLQDLATAFQPSGIELVVDVSRGEMDYSEEVPRNVV